MNKRIKEALIEYIENEIKNQKSAGEDYGSGSVYVDGVDYWFLWNRFEAEIYNSKIIMKNAFGIVTQRNNIIAIKRDLGNWVWYSVE